MFTIPADSEAFTMLKRMVNEPDTYKITVDVHADQQYLMLKRNEHIWSLPVNIEPVP